MLRYVHPPGGGDGVLIGAEEEELPFVDIFLVLDLVADLRPGEGA